MDSTASFGYWLRRRRKACDLTQAALAQLVGCAVITIRKIEADEIRPSAQIAEKLGECLAIPAEERASFLKAARAGRSTDQLALASQPVNPATAAPATFGVSQHALPIGTVTFLFTDIERSTTLWEQHGQAMRAALVRHDAILREAIEAHGGVVFKTVGDAVCAAFASAPEALATALDTQRALLAQDWGAIGTLRVRMALHTGSAEVCDGDYLGLPLSRVARLLDAGHGGQILLSQATQELVRDALPPDTVLRDLHEHRLKDLTYPEHIFQLLAVDLLADFPPLVTLDQQRTNLPVQSTPLIGREQEVVVVRDILQRPDVRLLTLTGPGGTGKTRLAVQAAAEMLEAFPQGVYLIPLGSISDPDLVITTIAARLGVQEERGRPLAETLQVYLRDRTILLVLDNFEQVLAATPRIAELLVVTRHLKILVTSRAVLHLYGEREFAVPPLTMPKAHQRVPLDRLTQYEAVRLFIARAQAVKADFAVTNESAPAVAEICHRLDGLPLAIELAAARSKLFSPQALLARLERRLPLLTGGARDLPARQRTLRNTIDWSYALLDTDEQTMFAHLGVFVGGCTLEAAEAVCSSSGALTSDVLDGLASLVDKSLLRQDAGRDGDPRLVMLETIREYAQERLGERGETAALRHLHAAYYLTLAEATEPKLFGAEQARWLNQLEVERDNLRAAHEWYRSDAHGAAQASRLVNAMTWFWYLRSYWSEARTWAEELLARTSPGEHTTVRAQGLFVLGSFAWLQGDYGVGRARLEESAALWREIGERRGLAYALVVLGLALAYQGEFVAGYACLDESVAIFREVQDLWGLALAVNSMGDLAQHQGEYERARSLFEESLMLYKQLANASGLAHALNDLAKIARWQGDDARAQALGEESLALGQEIGIKRFVALALHNLGWVALHQDDTVGATTCFKEGLSLYQDIGDKLGMLECVEGLAGVAAAQGQPERGARLFGVAEVLRASIGVPLMPAEQADYRRAVAAARAQLDDPVFAAIWATGRAMSLEQAIAFAMATSDSITAAQRNIGT